MRKSLVCFENFHNQPPLSSVGNAGRNAASLPTPILGVEHEHSSSFEQPISIILRKIRESCFEYKMSQIISESFAN